LKVTEILLKVALNTIIPILPHEPKPSLLTSLICLRFQFSPQKSLFCLNVDFPPRSLKGYTSLFYNLTIHYTYHRVLWNSSWCTEKEKQPPGRVIPFDMGIIYICSTSFCPVWNFHLCYLEKCFFLLYLFKCKIFQCFCRNQCLQMDRCKFPIHTLF
jgi:hypothetical protein